LVIVVDGNSVGLIHAKVDVKSRMFYVGQVDAKLRKKLFKN